MNKEKQLNSKELKKCPFCAEEIKNEAIKCKHCGAIVDEKIRKVEDNKKAKPKEGLFLQGMNLSCGCILIFIIFVIIAIALTAF